MDSHRIGRPSVIRRLGRAVLAASLVLFFLLCHSAAGQTATDSSFTSGFDAFGNARPISPVRRPIRIFQEGMQGVAPAEYRTLSRGVYPLEWVARFTTPANETFRLLPPRGVWGNRRGTVGSLPFGLGLGIATAGPSPRTQLAYRRYGGFERRVGDAPGDVSGTFTRRYALIEATSLNAPVHRANWKNNSVVGLRAAIDRTPFLSTEVPEPASLSSTLDEKLARGVLLSHRRTRAEAWAWFETGAYRRAARAFESAARLQPEDFEARIGELFCHVSLDATRTALALLGELKRRDWNPFLHDVNLADMYGSREEAGQVRIRTRLQAETAGDNPDAAALNAFVLWYLGDRDEALSAAVRLVRDPSGTAYSDWPAKMRAAQTGERQQP